MADNNEPKQIYTDRLAFRGPMLRVYDGDTAQYFYVAGRPEAWVHHQAGVMPVAAMTDEVARSYGMKK